MTTRNILIGAVVIIVILLGAFFMFKGNNNTNGTQGASQGQQGQNYPDNTTNQVQAQDVTVGTGAQATPGATVSVLYVGQLTNKTVFDGSAAHGNQPLTFTLGAQGLIPGFQIGVNGMKEGGERLISIPAALGYGAQDVKDSTGKVIIPANSTLIFDIKLVSVQASSSTPTAAPQETSTKKKK